MRIRTAFGAVGAVALSLVLASNPANPAVAASPVPPTPLLMVGPFSPDLTPPTAEQSRLWASATNLARRHPNDFTPVWLDKKSSTVHVSPTTAHGRTLLEKRSLALRLGKSAHGLDEVSQAAGASLATLEDLMNRLSDLAASDVPGAEEIEESEIDAQLGRAIVAVRTYSDDLSNYIASTFPVDLVAMRVDPAADVNALPVDSRATDTKPFNGGSQIGVTQPDGSVLACTNGVPWKDSSNWYMLIAGHCAPKGSSKVYTDASGKPKEGSITSGSRENWTDGTGTVAFTGGSYTRGDYALVNAGALSGAAVEPYIFRGGPGSSGSTKTQVYGWNAVTPQVGDQLCTSGRQTGEMCGWTIYKVYFNQVYDQGEGTARHISSAKKQEACLIQGDSGAPLYTVNSSGIYARGILSGSGGGGSDNWGGLTDPCWVFYSDLEDAYIQLPGGPATT